MLGTIVSHFSSIPKKIVRRVDLTNLKTSLSALSESSEAETSSTMGKSSAKVITTRIKLLSFTIFFREAMIDGDLSKVLILRLRSKKIVTGVVPHQKLNKTYL